MIKFSGGRVATTGQFRTIADLPAWIRDRGGIPVVWSTRTNVLLVGAEHSPQSWKLQQSTAASNIRIVYESELPAPEKILWVDKYRPRSLADVIGHAATIKDLVGWLGGWGKTGPRAALLTGPPGIGKTTVAHLLAGEGGYTVVEFNASDQRSANSVREILGRMGRATTLGAEGAKRILIMDEVDGMSAGDRGGLAELARVIREGTFGHPILCLANDRSSPKIRGLASACLDIRFARPTKTTIAKAFAGRGLGAAKDIEEMCERNGNDIRSILNSLQFSPRGAAAAADKDETHRLDPFSATGRLFGTVASLEDRQRAFFVDHSMVPLMVGEAILAAAAKTRGSVDPMEAAWRAADAMTDWDMLDRKIHRSQDWNLLPAASMAVIRAARAANGPPPFQIFPSWLGKQSKRTKHRRMIGELGQHMGSTCDLDTRNLLRTKLFETSLGPPQIVGELNGLRLTRDDMLETLVETVFKGDEATVAMDTKKKTALTREWKKAGLARTSNIVAIASASDGADECDIVDAYESDEDGMLEV